MITFIKVLINFSKFADSKLEAVCKAILKAMTGNSNFPTPTPTLVVIQDALDNFSNGLTAAATRARNAVALKNQYRKVLIGLMRQLGNYVNTICMGDVAMLTISGFALSKLPEPRHIEAPQNLVVLQGQNIGSLLCKIKAVQGADSYLFEYTTDPVTKDTNWISIPSSRKKLEIEGLEQGQKYWFRVAAVGSNGQVVYSVEVFQYVMQRSINAAA